MLSESYLCIIVHNPHTGCSYDTLVVNCFQNRIFALSFTTTKIPHHPHRKLWIAFRIVSLHYRSQQEGGKHITNGGCELLSESYLCIIVHNPKSRVSWLTTVVNCFQNRIFALSFTTFIIMFILLLRLWIAFRIVSLHYRSQHKIFNSIAPGCCELLSESYLCIIVHNFRKLLYTS